MILQFRPNSSHQKEVWKSTVFERALIAGFGAGKTSLGVADHVFLSGLNNPCNSLIVSPTFSIAKKTVIIELKDLLNRSKIPYRFNIVDKEFQMPWGNLIWIGSGDEPNSIKGPNLSHGLMDEPFIQQREVYDEMLGRIRDKRAKRLAMVLTGTPEGLASLKNWGYQEFIKNQKSNRLVVFGKTYDNPDLHPDYIKNLYERYGAHQREMYIEAHWLENFGHFLRPQYFGRFELKPPEVNDKGEIINQKIWNIYIDSAYGGKNSDSTAILSGSYDGQWFDIRDVRTVNLTTYALAQYLKEMLPEMGYTDESVIMIENAANGRPIYEMLSEETDLNIQLDKRKEHDVQAPIIGDVNAKAKRLLPQMAKIESGRVRLLEGAYWLQSFLDECSMFDPKKKDQEDDQIDCLSMFMRHARRSAIFEDYAM